jgi:hypothetical protein
VAPPLAVDATPFPVLVPCPVRGWLTKAKKSLSFLLSNGLLIQCCFYRHSTPSLWFLSCSLRLTISLGRMILDERHQKRTTTDLENTRHILCFLQSSWKKELRQNRAMKSEHMHPTNSIDSPAYQHFEVINNYAILLFVSIILSCNGV